MERQVYTIKQVADRLSSSVSCIRNLVRARKIKSFRVGTKIMITEESLNRLYKRTGRASRTGQRRLQQD